jgi:hypothetical protein
VSGQFTASGYTGTVSWRNRIAVVLLAVLAALPAAGALCAMTCLSASDAMTSHHGKSAAQPCDDATSEAGARVGSGSQHDCQNHDRAVIEITTTAAHRADAVISALVATTETVLPSLVRPVVSTRSSAYTPPPGTAPPTTTPLVLRV